MNNVGKPGRTESMQSHTRPLTIGVVLLATTLLSAAPTFGGDKDEVQHAVTRFYTALNAMFAGGTAPMEAVWSHADDVSYLPPDGRILVGWENVRSSWREQAALKLGGRVEPEDVHISVAGDVAVVCNFEKGKNMVDGKEQTVAIRASKVFRRENGEWKLVSDHADPLPFLQQ